MITIDHNPFPAVRVNWKGWRFTPRAIKYHSKMNSLRNEIWDRKKDIIQKLITWNKVIFFMPIPQSWSKKKKDKMLWVKHEQKPDTDNIWKAFVDTLFYEYEIDDKVVSKINCEKVWSNTWKITIE